MLVEELEELKQILTVKEQNMDNGLYKARTILISVTCSSNIT